MFSDKVYTLDLAKIHYRIVVNSKINIIDDFSATGKTTLINNVNQSQPNNITTPQLIGVSGLSLRDKLNKLVIIDDSDISNFTSKEEFMQMILGTPNIYLIMCRDLLSADYTHYRSVYRLQCDESSGRIDYYLVHKYKEYNNFSRDKKILLEGEKADLEYYNHLLSNTSIETAKGKNNIYNKAKHTEFDEVIADGAMLSGTIKDLLKLKSHLYLPDSFEYLMLLANDIDINLQDIDVDSKTIEQYCYNLIRTIYHDYDKSKCPDNLLDIDLPFLSKLVYVRNKYKLPFSVKSMYNILPSSLTYADDDYIVDLIKQSIL